jgi:hypothetical protein
MLIELKPLWVNIVSWCHLVEIQMSWPFRIIKFLISKNNKKNGNLFYYGWLQTESIDRRMETVYNWERNTYSRWIKTFNPSLTSTIAYVMQTTYLHFELLMLVLLENDIYSISTQIILGRVRHSEGIVLV